MFGNSQVEHDSKIIDIKRELRELKIAFNGLKVIKDLKDLNVSAKKTQPHNTN